VLIKAPFLLLRDIFPPRGARKIPSYSFLESGLSGFPPAGGKYKRGLLKRIYTITYLEMSFAQLRG